ncbi:MAG: riboflavin biosynthesis protein RibF [Candidatus Omnitrophica bacterium]|nr:riboflavin biosynthesis protein RibF [Candidatus Omnitrophota bacterium]
MNPRKTVVAIGIFDGVHCGHQAILKYAVGRAKALKAIPAALTFYPHPAAIVAPAYTPPLLLSLSQRLEEFRKLGIKRPEVLRFTRAVSRWTPEQFVQRLLVERLHASEVVVGHDFGFGHKRSGTVETLRELGRRFGFKVHVAGPVRVAGRRVASRTIRALIEKGKLAAAAACLGRPPQVTGPVVRGAGRGKKFGVPTANVQVETGLLPPNGVYAVWMKWPGSIPAKGVANLGVRPTVDRPPPKTPILEVHLLSKKTPALRGKSVQVYFGTRLRAEKKFSSVELLLQQIRKDIHAARLWHQHFRGSRRKSLLT